MSRIALDADVFWNGERFIADAHSACGFEAVDFIVAIKRGWAQSAKSQPGE